MEDLYCQAAETAAATCFCGFSFFHAPAAVKAAESSAAVFSAIAATDADAQTTADVDADAAVTTGFGS